MYFSVAQEPKSGPGRPVLEVSRSDIITHTHTPHTTHHTPHTTHTVALLRTSDQSISQTATCTTHNEHKRLTSMPSAEFEPTIPAIERLHIYGSDGA